MEVLIRLAASELPQSDDEDSDRSLSETVVDMNNEDKVEPVIRDSSTDIFLTEVSFLFDTFFPELDMLMWKL